MFNAGCDIGLLSENTFLFYNCVKVHKYLPQSSLNVLATSFSTVEVHCCWFLCYLRNSPDAVLLAVCFTVYCANPPEYRNIAVRAEVYAVAMGCLYNAECLCFPRAEVHRV